MITAQTLNIFLHKKQDYHIDAVQGETGRGIQMRIWSGDTLWRAEPHSRLQIRYQRPDGTGGVYDTMSDGRPAWSFEDDTLTILLAPQVLAFSGEVSLQVVLACDADQVSTFTIIIEVQDDLSNGTITGEDLVSLNGWIDGAVEDQVRQAERRWQGMYGVIDGCFELGELDIRDGNDWDSDRHIRTAQIAHGGRRICVSLPPEIEADCYYYDAKHKMLYSNGPMAASMVLEPAGVYFRVVASYRDGRVVTDVEDMAKQIILSYLSERNDAYRGNIVQLGHTRLEQCQKDGYYSIAGGDGAVLTDLPKEVYSGVLEVLPQSGAAYPLQRIVDSKGDIWVRTRDGFVRSGSARHKPVIIPIMEFGGVPVLQITLEEIQEAVADDQLVICKWGEQWLPLTKVENGIAHFNAVADDQMLHVELEGQTVRLHTQTLVTYPIPQVPMVSPTGMRYVFSVADAGDLKAVPVVPSNILFIGNAMLLGFGVFGMAAQDSEHDYYHYITNYLTGVLGAAPIARRLAGIAWEAQTDAATATEWVRSNVLPRLSTDIELVLIQLSDNVNTDEKLACFTHACEQMIRLIRQNAPNARVAWVSAWFPTPIKQEIIRKACDSTGALFIDISDLAVDANKNVVGNTYINSSGIETVITSDVVASHPNSRGMLAIADRILYRLGITASEAVLTDDTLDM